MNAVLLKETVSMNFDKFCLKGVLSYELIEWRVSN